MYHITCQQNQSGEFGVTEDVQAPVVISNPVSHIKETEGRNLWSLVDLHLLSDWRENVRKIVNSFPLGISMYPGGGASVFA